MVLYVTSLLSVPSITSDLYCTLEVDSFGYFVNKAKTRVYRDTTEPNWNEVRTAAHCQHVVAFKNIK